MREDVHNKWDSIVRSVDFLADPLVRVGVLRYASNLASGTVVSPIVAAIWWNRTVI